MSEYPRSTAPDRVPSPLAGERVRRLSRYQVDDLRVELGALYAAHSGREGGEGERLGRSFVRRLAVDVRRSGFALLIAESSALTACAYGFPLRARLFEIREIVVPRRVREQSPQGDWNLARRLQRALLGGQEDTTGVTVVDRTDLYRLGALRAWGWRDVPLGSCGVRPGAARRVLLLDPAAAAVTVRRPPRDE